jgi:predicted DNA binding CopG/RHH family protein
MRENYDFSKLKRVKSPYLKLLKQPVTLRLDRDSVNYFKELATETGIPYQNLINMYLRDCATNRRKPDLSWKPRKTNAHRS